MIHPFLVLNGAPFRSFSSAKILPKGGIPARFVPFPYKQIFFWKHLMDHHPQGETSVGCEARNSEARMC